MTNPVYLSLFPTIPDIKNIVFSCSLMSTTDTVGDFFSENAYLVLKIAVKLGVATKP